jgi:hypothetical protein
VVENRNIALTLQDEFHGLDKPVTAVVAGRRNRNLTSLNVFNWEILTISRGIFLSMPCIMNSGRRDPSLRVVLVTAGMEEIFHGRLTNTKLPN